MYLQNKQNFSKNITTRRVKHLTQSRQLNKILLNSKFRYKMGLMQLNKSKNNSKTRSYNCKMTCLKIIAQFKGMSN